MNKTTKIVSTTLAFLCACSSLHATAYNFWLTRGTESSGTNMTNADGTLSDRWIYTNSGSSDANGTTYLPTYIDSETGYVKTPATQTVGASDTIRLKIGAINCGLAGSATEESMLVLNTDLKNVALVDFNASSYGNNGVYPTGITGSGSLEYVGSGSIGIAYCRSKVATVDKFTYDINISQDATVKSGNNYLTFQSIMDMDFGTASTSRTISIKTSSAGASAIHAWASTAKHYTYNYYSTITQTGVGDVWFNALSDVDAGAMLRPITAFYGSTANTYEGETIYVLRSIYNLKKTGGAAAFKMTSESGTSRFYIGTGATFNFYGNNQLDVGNSILTFATPNDGYLVKMNLNGTNRVDFKNVNFNYTGTGTLGLGIALFDFGMGDNGFDSETSTGAGESTIINFGSAPTGYFNDGTGFVGYFLLKNYVIGEDKILFTESIMDFIDATIEDDCILQFDTSNYGENLVYGVDYKIVETNSGGYFEYAIQMIPEPSMYATLFGILALLGVMRSRKILG